MKGRFLGFGLAMLLAVSMARADDILLNSDFSDGKTHWHGDGDPGDAGGKLVIALKPDKWTGVTQRFSANAGALKLQVNYTLSSDCSLGNTGDKLIAPLTASALNEICGVENGIFNVTMYKSSLFAILVVGDGWMMSEDQVYKSRDFNPSASNTFTATITPWAGQYVDANLCLCFPPGTGTVTLTSVQLTPPGQ